MNKFENQTFSIGPHYEPQSNRRLWGLIAVSAVLLLIIAFYRQSFEFLIFGFCYTTVAFLLSSFFSNRNFSSDDEQGWLSICLVDDKLKIKQESSLLWAKDICNILSVEVESKKILSFSEKALLIKGVDSDSYYICIPTLNKCPAEEIAEAITERVVNAQTKCVALKHNKVTQTNA